MIIYIPQNPRTEDWDLKFYSLTLKQAQLVQLFKAHI